MKVEGVVSGVRYYSGEREYSLTDGKGDYTFRSRESIPSGSSVAVEADAVDGFRLAARSVAVLSGTEAQKTYGTVVAGLKKSASVPAAPSILSDGITAKLWPAMKEAALSLLCAKKLGRAVLLRFHGDADGICGAFALTSAVSCRAFQQNSAIYSVRDALRDMAAIGQENRPLIILLDFGSNDASVEGLNLLKAAGIETMIIDHHPPGKANDVPIINPFRVESGSVSRYTAGYLACEIAVACGLPKERGAELARVACSGDKSTLLASDGEDAKKALVLDFLASHVSFGNNLDFYRSVMAKHELFSSIILQADESISDAAEKALAKSKKQQRGELEIVSFPLDALVKKGEWPPSSKITTRVYDLLCAQGGRPLLCIGYTERSIIIRLNDKAAALGLSANEFAERIKVAMADFVDGGGGHVKAGAIRVKRGFSKEVLNELLRQVQSS
jgi:RecJ-like exonuclease